MRQLICAVCGAEIKPDMGFLFNRKSDNITFNVCGNCVVNAVSHPEELKVEITETTTTTQE